MSEHEQKQTTRPQSTVVLQPVENSFATALKKDGDIYTVFLYDKSRFESDVPTFDPTELKETEYVAKLSFNKKTGQTIEINIGLVQGSDNESYEPKEIQKIVNYAHSNTNSLASLDEGRIALAAYISSAVSNQEKYLGEGAPIRFCLQHTVSDVARGSEDERKCESNKMMGETIKVLTDGLRKKRLTETYTAKKPPRFICMPYSAYTKTERHVGTIVCDLDATPEGSMMYFDSGDTFRKQGLASGEEKGSIEQAGGTFGCLATERLKTVVAREITRFVNQKEKNHNYIPNKESDGFDFFDRDNEEFINKVVGKKKVEILAIKPINDSFPQFHAQTSDCGYWVESFNLTLIQTIEKKEISQEPINSLDQLRDIVNSGEFQSKLRENLTKLKETQRTEGIPLDNKTPTERSVQLEVEQALSFSEIPLIEKDSMKALSDARTGAAVQASQKQSIVSVNEKLVNKSSKIESLP